MSAKDPWVRVRDGLELNAGVYVLLIRPGCGAKEHRFFLLNRERYPSPCEWHGECVGWTTTNQGHGDYGSDFCPEDSIREGRLYRLAPDATTDDAETTTAPKRRERVG